MSVGSLYVMGISDPRSASEQLSNFLDFLAPLENQISDLLRPDAMVHEVKAIPEMKTLEVEPGLHQNPIRSLETPLVNDI